MDRIRRHANAACPAPKHWPDGSDAVVLPIIVFLESRRNDERSNSVAKPSTESDQGHHGARSFRSQALSTDTPTVLWTLRNGHRRGVVNLSVDPENRSLQQSGGLWKASGDSPHTSCAVILSVNVTETVH